MPPRPRIALVSPTPSSLEAQLDSLAHAPEVTVFPSLAASAPHLARQAPHLLLVEATALDREEVGALTMLRSLVASLDLVIVAPAGSEAGLRDAAARCGARVITAPCTTGQLAQLLDSALTARPSTPLDELLQLARGISDEINNPLLFAAGHLQLLAHQIGTEPNVACQGHIHAIQAGHTKVAQALDRIRVLARLDDHAERRRPVDVLAELERAHAARPSGAPELDLVTHPRNGPLLVSGDSESLSALLRELLEVIAGLAAPPARGRIEIQGTPTTLTLTAGIPELDLPAWMLPLAFGPYYLSRVLQPTVHGLSLFLVQAVTHAHGGRAVARPLPPKGLALEITLPRSSTDPTPAA